MCVYVCACVYLCVPMRVHACARACVFMYACVHLRVCVSVGVCVCVCKSMHLPVSVSASVCVRPCARDSQPGIAKLKRKCSWRTLNSFASVMLLLFIADIVGFSASENNL